MEHYAIGLDIGITSVGWAIVALDEQEHPCGIIKMGARIFDSAEHPKTGDSLAAPRRDARSARRRLRRHRHRNERIRYLLLQKNILTQAQLESLFNGRLEDIYALRVRALDEKLTSEEFARILIHLAQHRGFLSNRKNPATKEDGVILSAVNENKQRMITGNYRTIGEMLLKDQQFSTHKRNKGGQYIATVARQQVEEEVRAIFAAQRTFSNTAASAETEEEYLAILLSQRSFDDGPGGNSPYGGSQIERMIGSCTFFPEEPRAAKATYSFEYFNLLEKINHIRIQQNGKSTPLDAQQRDQLIQLALSSENIDFARIRKVLALPEEAKFNTVRYLKEDAEKKTKLNCMCAYHQMRKAFNRISPGYINSVSVAHRNAIATALTLYRTSQKIHDYLKAAGVPDILIEAAEELNGFTKAGHLSVKACDALIPYLEQGMNYSDACAAAGFQFKGHCVDGRTELLHPTDEDYAPITSPVARRAISQTFKVVNAIIRRQGTSPLFINVELAREMAKRFSERKELEKQILGNQAENERIMERLRKEFGLSAPKGQDLVKFKLWEQQGGVCPYSQKQLSISKIFEPNYAEVDHIIPYSISFDDSYKNKVLVLAGENRDKSNRLPLQYLTGKRRDEFIVWVRNNIKDHRKQQLLLKEQVTKEDEERFKERNLQDTKTASRFVLNYLADHLLFAESKTGKRRRVTAVNGAVTSHLRARWGISKIRADGDVHHAVDALVVACTTNAMIQRVSKYAAYRECKYHPEADQSLFVDESTGEVIDHFPYPWPQFRKELEGHLSSNPAHMLTDLHLPMYVSGQLTAPTHPIFISRMPKRKISGPAHKDTVKSPKALEDNRVIVKRSLQDLNLKNIENYYAPESDRLLYEAIVQRLTQFGGDGKKAFAEEFRKPKSDGTPGPVVKKVKLWEPTTLNVSLHDGKGVADNESMVRIDVFYVEDDGYYLVPIYVADACKAELPNRACVANKKYDQWKEMQEENFIFSLYPNDLIYISSKRPIKCNKKRKESTLSDKTAYSVFAYYTGADISCGNINCILHDGAHEIKGLGIKTLECIEKYEVDILGEYHKITKEKRQSFVLNKKG